MIIKSPTEEERVQNQKSRAPYSGHRRTTSNICSSNSSNNMSLVTPEKLKKKKASSLPKEEFRVPHQPQRPQRPSKQRVAEGEEMTEQEAPPSPRAESPRRSATSASVFGSFSLPAGPPPARPPFKIDLKKIASTQISRNEEKVEKARPQTERLARTKSSGFSSPRNLLFFRKSKGMEAELISPSLANVSHSSSSSSSHEKKKDKRKKKSYSAASLDENAYLSPRSVPIEGETGEEIFGGFIVEGPEPPQTLSNFTISWDSAQFIKKLDHWIVEPPLFTFYYLTECDTSRFDTLQFPQLNPSFYRLNFASRAHKNYIGLDKMCGPVVVSFAKGKGPYSHAIFRTKEGDTKFLVPSAATKKYGTAALIKELGKNRGNPPNLNLPTLRKIESEKVVSDLSDLERGETFLRHKIGVLLVLPGQTTDNEYLNNRSGSAAYEEFLSIIGDRIVLKGFLGYNGGLDTNSGTTGIESIHTSESDCEIMFHVSTLIHFTPGDPQQIERKRHLGNDIVNIIFIDGENQQFDPASITTNFIHVYFVISPVRKVDEKDQLTFRVEVVRKCGVPYFGPPLPDPPIFNKEQLQNFLKMKLINAERAGLSSPAFSHRLRSTRATVLNSILSTYF